MSLRQDPCIELLKDFYRLLVSKWINDATLQGLDFNTYLQGKDKNSIMKDMDTIINTKGIQKGYFCKCFKQIYNALNNQLDVASTILGLVIPGLSIDEDVLKVIVAAALEYCGFTTQANELLESVVKGLIIAAIVSVLVYFIIRHK